MANGPIPRQQKGALTWMVNFASKILADPARYGLTPADAASIHAAVDAFAEAMGVIDDPDRKTKPSVAAKNDARRSAEQICLQYYATIKANAGVPDDEKISLGVRPVNSNRSPITVPDTCPTLGVIGSTPTQHHLRFHDSFEQERSAKPFGAAFIQIYAAVGDDPHATIDESREVGLFTRNPIAVTHKAEDNQKMAVYRGRWVSRKGEVGPWSAPVSFAIAA